MWRETDRRKYRQAGDCLPSDLTDPEWERLAQLIPPAKPGGRPRKTDMRSAMNAIFYLLRTGCPWRYLPRRVFPPRSTVYNIFRAFQRQGVWEAIWEELRAALRERLGGRRAPAPASSTAARSSRPKRARLLDFPANPSSTINLFQNQVTSPLLRRSGAYGPSAATLGPLCITPTHDGILIPSTARSTKAGAGYEWDLRTNVSISEIGPNQVCMIVSSRGVPGVEERYFHQIQGTLSVTEAYITSTH